MAVYGLGRRSTPEPFVATCDRFIYFELLTPEPQAPARTSTSNDEPTLRRPDLERAIGRAR